MTVIVWDGKMLAADQQAEQAGFRIKVAKILRVPGGVAGFCGDVSHGQALLAWCKAGRKRSQWPRPEDGEYANCLFVDNKKRLFVYSGAHGPLAEQYENQPYAIGSGANYALAAMYLGHDARRAVEVAIALDMHCGFGVETQEL